jgi:Cu+-exporting ATPase
LLAVSTVFVLVVGFLLSGVTVIGPGEVGASRRWGEYQPPLLGPGLHVRWPSPVETVTRVEPDLVRLARMGLPGPAAMTGSAPAPVAWSASHGARRDEGALFFTGDENLVELAGVVEYRWTEEGVPRLLFEVASVEAVVSAAAEGAFREVAGRTPLDDILASRRSGFESEVEDLLRRRLAANGLGVTVDRVRVVDAHPPREVVPAYRDVSAAVSDAARFRNEAESYAAERRLAAVAEAQARRDSAAALAAQLKGRAEGQRRAFLAQSSAHAARPGLTEFRLLRETLALALAGRPKLILDPRAGGRRHVWLADPARLGLGPIQAAEAATPAPPEPED